MRGLEMAVQIGPIFPHRLNPDGYFDSICPTCFLTVSAKRNETELAMDESNHVCYGLATDVEDEILRIFNRLDLSTDSDQKEYGRIKPCKPVLPLVWSW
jgi:hypothetical protein